MDGYKTIERQGLSRYEEKKSVFYGEAVPVCSEEEALSVISLVKKKYPDAKHHVYAYVLRDNSIMRFSDDGEPQGTAGMPVLDSIRKNGLTDTVVVVTRYFGGTLLGTGGLVRAYTEAALGAINNGNIIIYDNYTLFELSVSYSDFQKINSFINSDDIKIDEIKYFDNVKIYLKVKSGEKDMFEEKISDITCARAVINNLGEKFDY